jgi:putative Mg2+ transporter-C (MgtC) family protein
VTAAIGAAAGGGLPVLAAVSAGIYFLIVLGFPFLVRRLPVSTTAISVIRVRYLDGRGLLRDVLHRATARGFVVSEVATESVDSQLVEVTLQVHGRASVNELAAELSEVAGVSAVIADDVNSGGE